MYLLPTYINHNIIGKVFEINIVCLFAGSYVTYLVGITMEATILGMIIFINSKSRIKRTKQELVNKL